MKTYNVIIIGGGAAGLMAAITAGRLTAEASAQAGPSPTRGSDILIIERNKGLGRKILVTGNGRCNLTNTQILPDISSQGRDSMSLPRDKYYGANTKCLYNIFSQFSSDATMEFFEALGARLKTEEQGRVFPMTNQASTIVDLLSDEITGLGVNVRLEERVLNLTRNTEGWVAKTDKDSYHSRKVILTTGGASYPQLGSTGDGYGFCQRLGLRLIEPRPALVPLELNGNWFHKLQGVKADVDLVLTQHNKTIASETGELLFTHYGISGPIVLNLSRLASGVGRPASGVRRPEFITHDAQPTAPDAFINFFPGYDAAGLAQLLSERWKLNPHKTLLGSLIGLLPKKLGQVLINELKLSPVIPVAQVAKNDLHLISQRLAAWPITVKRPRPFAEAMVTAGGVAMDEVNPRTMESIKCPGLYLAGEILDIDGVSGGYNLQFAWSTGHIAGLQCNNQ